MVIWTRQYKVGSDIVLAMADQGLMDKRFEQGEMILEISSFYRGKLVAPEQAAKLTGSANIINAVGEKTIKLLSDAGLITKENSKTIEGVPHIQIVMVR
ncbi:MAG: DUF424 family protein [Candidatus Altiarchaeota archaeon]|nr:DUF424 family protein [Candidatus Altiarchaeota archaeon]